MPILDKVNTFVKSIAATDDVNSNESANTEQENKYTSKKYSYHFGIDDIKFSQININETMFFISDEIEIGTLSKSEYIQLASEYSEGDYGSVEFYILDGPNETPILPCNTKSVMDEKVFYGYNTRFTIDEDNDIIVKKDGAIADVTFEKAKESNDKNYTVSYTPIDAHNIRPTSDIIKVKAILRTYDKDAAAPYIKSIAIKKYGGTLLWDSEITK